ncbi:PilZ domain-containing protein [Thalassotalea psychrophila]|uniref:PilZ domain-containing protein n=1 Tax=Thalassotalea psychrophila TaxID=3065647 RepID=A0ABY9TST4_9GAMM|nr:PilZ domain-containing protein [Colwelliaceae bacterium SQ149]
MSIERRFHPRKDVSFSVSIVLTTSELNIESTAVNLSRSGIQLSVDKTSVDLILEQGTHPTQFKIQLTDNNVDLFTVRLVVNRRISQNQFLLGLKFIDISVEQLATIDTLLNH